MLDNLFSIKDKIVLVTGAGKGIGHYLSIEMAKRNAIVYGLDVKFSEKIQKQFLENLFQTTCDVTNTAKFNRVCEKIFLKHKKIDVLINNAGVSYPEFGKKFYSEENWGKTLAVNLTSSFTCSQAVAKFMIKNKGGSIINITSINAELGFPDNPAYVASKGGLKMLSKALARDWGKFGIRVNNVGPGYIKTDMTKKTYQNKKLRKLREQKTMLGRWGNPADLIGPCVFLSSSASDYITGQDIYVDGGWIANGIPDT